MNEAVNFSCNAATPVAFGPRNAFL